MLLDGALSWRQRGWPQPVNEAQDHGKEGSWDCDLRQLESDVAAMAHDLGTDLDELFAQRSVANALLPPIRLTSSFGSKAEVQRRPWNRPLLGEEQT